VNEFVDECRREWQRLGVPDPVANEMAADLTADLEEAAAEGGSPEDVLGNSAFDPRRFAAAWAIARGVTSQPTLERPTRWRPSLAVALIAFVGTLVIGAAGLALSVGSSSRAIGIVSRRVIVGPGPLRPFSPGPWPLAGPGRFVLPIVGTDFQPLALMLFIIAGVGLVLLVVLYWSPWSGPRRYRKYEGRGRPNWN
jgi:hypothetical protein